MTGFLLRAGLAAAVLTLGARGAAAQQDPSVLVQLSTLHKGSLPRIVTAYGHVQAGAPAQRSVVAPLAATVDSVDVEPGQKVAQGAPLLRLVPDPESSAAYAQAQSALRAANTLVSHTRGMVAQHLATAAQLADAEKARADAEATLNALKAQGAQGPQVLRAPFAAIVTRVAASPGSIVTPGAALVDLARPQGLILHVGVTPQDAGSIAAGDKAIVTPIGGGAGEPGTVVLRGRVVQPDGLVAVDISVPDQMFVGQMAAADITTGEITGYVVPHAAILVNGQGQTYVVQSVHMTARKVTVQVLGHLGGRDVITGPLDPAAPLVLAGNYQLDNGMKMRVAETPGKAAQ